MHVVKPFSSNKFTPLVIAPSPCYQLILLRVNLSDAMDALSRAKIGAPKKDENGVESCVTKAFNLMFASEIDLNDLLAAYRQEEASDLFQITSAQYVANKDAKTRGTANPSVMNNPFWMFQVGPGGLPAWTARTAFGNIEEDDLASPVWCFTRLGATRTKLPDGRVVCIGGEHEDYYDPDFFIYNGKSFPPAANTQSLGAIVRHTP